MADLMTRPATGSLLGFDPFRSFFGNAPNGYGYGADVQKTESGWTVEIPVPGYKPDQIDVTIEDRILTVSGKNERRSFQRTILVPDEVDEGGIQASVEHGMLTLALALHPKAQPRKIAVKTVE